MNFNARFPSRNSLSFTIIFLTSLFLPITATTTAGFNFPTFTPHNLTLLGDAYLKSGSIGLTRSLQVPSTSSGTAIYNTPLRFIDLTTNTTASFTTKFTFTISNINPTSTYGDGLTFFISPSNLTLGSPGGFLGLVNSSQLTKNRFLAVEFDTKLDSHFQDPSNNHIGFDIDSLTSIGTIDLSPVGIDLKSGTTITAWIDYKDDRKRLRVYLNYSDTKPQTPVLKLEIDLSGYLNEFMFVGFSGSTEGSTETHVVERWSFQTYGFHSLKLNPHNVSDSSVIVPHLRPVPRIGGSGDGLNHREKVAIGLGTAVPAFCCALLVIFGWVSIRKWKGIKMQRSFKAEIVTGPREFSYKELKVATRGFHSSRILGHGAFGTVYKAFFVSTGTISAVKRSKHTQEGKTEFLAELSIIACLRHKNLVQLQGWCIEKDELLLVYEFMPNGSLDNALYPEPNTPTTNQNNNSNNHPATLPSPLPWPCRYNIALGLASVLSYLHQECEQQVIHRDIKTSNVLLDGNFNPRLGDFGLAKLTDHDRSPVSTLTAGTMGYLAPEYLQCGTASDKTDVYSYGVVVLELACGRRPIEKEMEQQESSNGNKSVVNLVDYVWGLYGEGKVIEAADERLKGEFCEEEMERLLMIGLSCANPDGSERPNMRRVFQILNKEADVLALPKSKPTLVFSCSLPLCIDDIVSSCSSESSSGSSSTASDQDDGGGVDCAGGEQKAGRKSDESNDMIEVQVVTS